MPNRRAGFFYALVASLTLLGFAANAQTIVAGTTPGQFAVSPSGAATYRIPIQVPPGVAGMEPRLELVYNSQSGNGMLGMGWGLSGLSAISRCPRTMASDGVRGTVELNNADRFCLDGQRLLLTTGVTYGTAATEYRTERESFSRIIANGGDNSATATYSGPTHFIVKTKAGLTLEFGNTTNSRIEAPGKAAIFTWALNRISDTKGNYLTVAYTEDTANGSYVPYQIDYTGNTTGSKVPTLSVKFIPTIRTDTRPFYVGGVQIKSNQRLGNIQTFAGTTLIKDYQLTYLADAVMRNSTLTSLRECDGITSCKAVKTFEHTPVVNTLAASAVGSSGAGYNAGYGAWVDFNADGKTDFCMGFGVSAFDFPTAYRSQCALSTGTGFAPAFEFVTTPFDWSGDSTPDQNGDGIPDLCGIHWDSGGSGEPWVPSRYCSLSNGMGANLGGSFVVGSGGGAGDPGPMSADVNGDGRDDLCGTVSVQVWEDHETVTKFQPQCLLSTGTGWSGTVGSTLPYVGSSDYSSNWVDVNGDGLADHCKITGVGVPTCTLSTGTALGAVLTGPSIGAALTTGRGWVDANGDGKIDYCYIDSSTVYAYTMGAVKCALNTGTGFGPRIASDVMSLGGEANRTWVDVDGDGKADFCRELTANQIACNLSTGDGFAPTLVSGAITLGMAPKKWADVNGDGVLDYCRNIGGTLNCATSLFMDSRIDRIIDGVGTSATYTAIANQSIAAVTPTSIYIKDATGPYPLVSKQIPAQVVASVTSSNGIGGTVVTNYTYGGLKAEIGTGRGMLGFRWIKSKEVDTGIESYTEYRQDWPYVGIPLKSETRLAGAGNGGVLKRSTTTVACQIPQTAAACTVAAGNRYFPHVTQSVDESWDLGGLPYPSITSSYVYGQSPQYGDPTQVTVSTNDGASKTTVNEYWPTDTATWILGRLKKTTVTHFGSTAIAGGSPGEIMALGLTVTPLSATVELAGAGTGSTSVSATAIGGVGPYAYNLTRITGSRTMISNGNTANPTFAATLAAGEDFTETLRVTLTDAFGGSTFRDVSVRYTTPYVLNQTISVNTSNYNLRAAAIAAGWNQERPLKANVTINTGVMVSASSVANYAFDTGTGFPAGSALTLINNGSIIGMGGTGGKGGFGATIMLPTAGQTGGPALRAQVAITVTNTGTIGGGGTGGFGGPGWDVESSGGCCSSYFGWGGGGGRSGATNSAGGWPVGHAGTSAAGGAGEVIHNEWGMVMSASEGGGPYGGGPAVIGNTNITWLATGTRLGALN